MCGSRLAPHVQSQVYSVVCLLGIRLPDCSKKPHRFGIKAEYYSVIFSRVRQTAKSDLLGSLCLSVRMVQLGSRRKDFHEI